MKWLDEYKTGGEVSRKISKLVHEGKPQKQAIAIALDMQRRGKLNDGGWLSKYNVIEDNNGQWTHPGKITRINSNNITMKGVTEDLIGVSDEGDVQYMTPNKNYKFKGKSVIEYPIDKLPNWLEKYGK